MLDATRRDEILAFIEPVRCFRTLRFELLELADGLARIRAPRIRELDGAGPGYHGGLIAMVADCVAWLAIVTRTGPREPLVTSDLSLRYLRPCEGDLIATARLIKLGRTLCPTHFEAHDEAGQLVATGSVCYFRVPPQAG